MLTLYPSNKLEHLSFLLNAVLKKSQQPVLQAKTVLVESTGMQHWLNLQIAEHSGISMNLDFPMPTRYVWQLCRSILGEDKVPYQSVYKREVMQWRIDTILRSKAFEETEFEANIRAYWESQKGSAASQARRVDLSRHIADTFEQYLMFRPQWLLDWEEGKRASIATLNENQAAAFLKHEQWQSWLWNKLVEDEPNHPARLQKDAIAKLNENHQVLLKVLPREIYFFGINTMAPQTLDFFSEIAKYCEIHFFHLNPCVDYWGNALSDKALAAKMRQGKIDEWVQEEGVHPLLRNLGQQGKDLFNLLSNAQNYEIAAFDTEHEFFESSEQQCITRLAATQLGILEGRKDFSEISDAGLVSAQSDSSLVLRSCHSALREVQVLHDYLLEKLAADDSLQAQDILVMCPAIEDYSPFINAIFARGVTSLNKGQEAKVPCSIADRNPLDSEPLIAAFVNLLSLPDSRFSVVELMTFFRTSAVMSQFELTNEMLDLFARWIDKSNIFWGLDASHKHSVVDDAEPDGEPDDDLSGERDCDAVEVPERGNSDATYTWEWGLSRLLDGFICSDNALFTAEGASLLHQVEGQSSVALGRLMQIIEQLNKHRILLAKFRTMSEWKAYLLTLKADIFDSDASTKDLYADQLLTQTLGNFFEHFDMALATSNELAEQKWSIATIRGSLEQAFSSPDSRNHFMTGQVTFCSMMPMRSIPFKVIAILGLNDEDFPRKNNQVDLNLINHAGRQLGDRSRRGDDRYLFLEAILSARETLYLSYQGKSIKNNKEKEPSLVFSEFLAHVDTLESTAQHTENKIGVAQQSLHPFSADNYIKSESALAFQKSYDKGWYRLMRSIYLSEQPDVQSNEDTQGQLITGSTFIANENIAEKRPTKIVIPEKVDMSDLVQFFKDPLKTLANKKQGLYLDEVEQEFVDVEPFSPSNLDQYSVISSSTKQLLNLMVSTNSEDQGKESVKEQVKEQVDNFDESTKAAIETVFKQQLGTGDIPDDVVNKTVLAQWLQQGNELALVLQAHYPLMYESKTLILNLESAQTTGALDSAGASKNTIRLDYSVGVGKQKQIVLFTSSSNSAKHLMEAWLLHLCFCAEQGTMHAGEDDAPASPILLVSLAKNAKKQAVIQQNTFRPVDAEHAKQQLILIIHHYAQGMLSPSLAIHELAAVLIKKVTGDKEFNPHTASKDEYLQHAAIKDRWEKVFTDTYRPAFFVQSPYFGHYFDDIPQFNAANVAAPLACYQSMLGALMVSTNVVEEDVAFIEHLLGNEHV